MHLNCLAPLKFPQSNFYLLNRTENVSVSMAPHYHPRLQKFIPIWKQFVVMLSSSRQLKFQSNWDSIITTCLPTPTTPQPTPPGIVLRGSSRLAFASFKDTIQPRIWRWPQICRQPQIWRQPQKSEMTISGRRPSVGDDLGSVENHQWWARD